VGEEEELSDDERFGDDATMYREARCAAFLVL
jgi:hypothetical protein